MSLFLQLTINGILLGAFYAAMTMGFSIIWGVMRLINLAHGEFLLMGAYVAWFFFNPTREQSLTIGGSNTAEIESTILLVFIGGALIGGAILSEFIIAERYRIDDWLRRGLSLGASGLVAAIIYFIWRSQEFQPFDISMMFIVFAGLALSIAFVINHVLLRKKLPNPWVRRAVGYAVGIPISLIAYNRWEAAGFPSIDPFLVIPIILLIFFALGHAMQKALFNRLVQAPHLIMLLITFALKIILQNVGQKIYLADPRRINVTYNDSWQLIGDLRLSKVKFAILIVCVILFIALIQFLQRTKIGAAIRAAAQNHMAARLMGININETYAITFGIALALTAVVGAMMGTFVPITPFEGSPWTLRAFAIVALGGLGRVQGVVAGGMALGLAETYIGGTSLGTGWAVATAFIVLVVMLVLRPQGITGGLRPEEA